MAPIPSPPARVLVLAAVLLAAAAPAQALRCGSNIVSKGDSTLRLTRYCGQPTQIEQRNESVPVEVYDTVRGVYVTDYRDRTREVWVYNFGPQRFITYIEVRDGRIESIETGGYGF